MSWWIWTLLATALLLAMIAGWVLREYRAIPVAERRTLRELRDALPAELRNLRLELGEDRAVRRCMDAKARKARREIYDEEFERTREEIRRERS